MEVEFKLPFYYILPVYLDGFRMIIGIDGSNCRAGGGLTHLHSVLAAANPSSVGIKRVIVWVSTAIAERLSDVIEEWLDVRVVELLDRSIFWRSVWQRWHLPRLGVQENIDLLWAPGGNLSPVGDIPAVTMSQNMLVFQQNERRLYGLSWMRFRLRLLQRLQGQSFARADGVIFLSQFARDYIMDFVPGVATHSTIIPHGIAPRFFRSPQAEHPKKDEPWRLVYVSIVDVYKHQWEVAEAVCNLCRRGYNLHLDLVGPAYPPSLKRLQKTLDRVDPQQQVVHYLGSVPHNEIHQVFYNADLFVFASSCENLPITLLEGMASGIPIASSDRGPMPEVLGDAGVYFDPENPSSIEAAIAKLIDEPDLRMAMAQRAYKRATAYSWETCATQTFAYLADVARSKGQRL